MGSVHIFHKISLNVKENLNWKEKGISMLAHMSMMSLQSTILHPTIAIYEKRFYWYLITKINIEKNQSQHPILLFWQQAILNLTKKLSTCNLIIYTQEIPIEQNQ